MRSFDYYRPKDYEEAFELLSRTDQAVLPLAGGTDLIPQVRDGVTNPQAVVDVKHLPGMRDLKIQDVEPCCGCSPGECLYVGAAVRMNELARSELVRDHWKPLAMAAYSVGNEQVRNRATIGGNLCTASPAADSAPALLVLEAVALIRGATAERCVPVAQFFTGPKRSALRPGELLVGLLIPRPTQGALSHHEKLGRRKAGDLSIASVAAMALPHNGGYRWRLALGAVAPTPIRSPEAEAILAQGYDSEAIDRAAAAAYGCCCPITDIRSGLEYRQAMVVNLSRRVIETIVSQMPAV